MTPPTRVLAIIPALNEEQTVATVVSNVRLAGFDALVVSDGSTDDTAPRAREAGANVVELPLNVGVGGALRCGFRWAVAHGFDTVVQVDADGQHRPEQIQRLLDHLTESGASMVVGSRFMEQSGDYEVSRARRTAMRMLSHRVKRRTGVAVHDATSGFRAISEPLLSVFAASYPSEYLGDTVEALAIAGASGATVAEYPVDMVMRAHGVGSAGRMAGAWYTVRVMIALELMGRSNTRTVQRSTRA